MRRPSQLGTPITHWQISVVIDGRRLIPNSDGRLILIRHRHLLPVIRFAIDVRYFDSERARPIEAHTQYEYGAMLRARGRPVERVKADALLGQAIATATELGMAKIVYDAHLLMRMASRLDLLQT